jgi:hypothetical protein
MPDLGLTIPCTPGKRWTDKDVRPVLVFLGLEPLGAVRTQYRCPFCESPYTNRHSCGMHMGIDVMLNDIKKTGCRVLRVVSSERERYVRANFGLVMQQIQKKYGTA